jgi:hypothetical protein
MLPLDFSGGEFSSLPSIFLTLEEVSSLHCPALYGQVVSSLACRALSELTSSSTSLYTFLVVSFVARQAFS